MASDKTFMERLRVATPAPPDETEQYRKFNYVFSALSLMVVVCGAYGAYIFGADLEGKAIWLSRLFPFLEPRMRFLQSVDYSSYLAYGATVLSAMISVPIVVLVWVAGYWKTVVSLGKCRALMRGAITSVLFSIFVSFSLTIIAFVDVPETYDSRWPGMVRFLFWPIFPAFGAGAAWILGMVVFSILVGIFKFVAYHGGRHDRE